MPRDAGGGVVVEVSVAFVGALGGDLEGVGDVTPGGAGGDGSGDLGFTGGLDFGGVGSEFRDPGEVAFNSGSHRVNRS